MADTKISDLPSGAGLRQTDETVAARSGTNVKLVGPDAVRGALKELTFRPGYVGNEPGTFTSWADLMAMVAKLDEPIKILFDDRDGAITIPTGTHAFQEGTIFSGFFRLTAGSFTNVTCADGCKLVGVTTFERGIRMISVSTSPVIEVGASELKLVTFERGGEAQGNGTAAFMEVDGAGGVLFIIFYGGTFLAGTGLVAELKNGSVGIINSFVEASIAADVLASDAGSVWIVNKLPNTTFNAQSGITGALIETFAHVASKVGYTPAVTGDWTGADPTTVQEALDRLAAHSGPIA